MNTHAKVMCSSVLLLGVWGSAEAQDAPTLSLTTNSELTDTMGFFHFNSSVYRGDDSTRTLKQVPYGTVPATVDPAFPSVLPIEEQAGMPLNPRYSYTFLGIYNDENSLVSILLKPEVAANAIANRLNWDQVFLPSTPGYLSEADIALALRQGGSAETFLYPRLSLLPNWNEPATLVYFSAATRGGSGFAFAPGAVPEPTTLAVLSLGALAVLRRRKK
ncbi:PEP-CTERM sorting domain-containing protein [bacterium]|nr:MAG: PEP-CTERM sorting domain-containing protein [bacterium]